MHDSKAASSTEACFKHYMRTTKDGVTRLSAFVGYEERTVRRWWCDGPSRRVPIGWGMLKLRYFLQKEGYNVRELEEQPIEVRALGRLIAHHGVDPHNLRSELGLSADRTFQALFRSQTHRWGRRRKNRIVRVLGKYRELLEGGETSCAATRSLPAVIAVDQPLPTVPPNEAAQERRRDVNLLVTLARGFIQLLGPLAATLLEEQSPAERICFRESFSGRELYEFVDTMRGLLSEEARKNIIEQRKKR